MSRKAGVTVPALSERKNGRMFDDNNAEYYPHFGFDKASAHGIGCEYDAPDEAFMVLELREGALAGREGTVKYQPEFGDA
ncbi:hypothetical protein ACFLWV_00570 [Chloroflexota bacterium]